MKALWATLFICTLYITLECANRLYDSRIIVNTYPKKAKAPLKKSIQIVNSRKFEKLDTLENRKANFKKSREEPKNYTAFPINANNNLHEVPESSNLQVDASRKRVKKVLPVHGSFLIRKKRAAKSQVNTTRVVKVAKKNKNIKRNRNNRKRIKRKGLNKNVRNSTLKKNKPKNKSKNKGPFLRNKTKKRNTNITKIRKAKQGKKRASSNLTYTKKHKNHSKFLLPGSIVKDGTRKNDARKPKLEKIVTKEHDKKVRNRRLIAGRDAMIQDYPYVVSIQKDHQHWCAGALLNPRLVITTANCVWKAKRITRMRVRAGSRHMERGGQLVKVQEVAKHPMWSIRSSPDNDLALLLLNRNIKFSDTVHAVDLPNRAMWPAFEDVWITSWGAERRDGIFQTMGVTLQVYHAMLLDHEKCNNVTMRFGVPVSENFICVAQTGRRAPCTRDTGAPAVSDGILWGVASWGIRKLCGTERFPAMFSYTASRSNLDFITNATHYLMSDKRYYPYADRFVLNQLVTTSTDATRNFF